MVELSGGELGEVMDVLRGNGLERMSKSTLSKVVTVCSRYLDTVLRESSLFLDSREV